MNDETQLTDARRLEKEEIEDLARSRWPAGSM